jgi:Abnormal spindle-like microcephaly-assoc'd, ASPM-SPD-2-Hydin/Fibronectin type III domain
VGLTSSSSAVTVPATVDVAANGNSAGFPATVSSVTAAQSVTLTASAGGISKTFALQLNAASTTVPTLTISTASLAFGNVTVNMPSTLPVTLTSVGTAPVTINSATLSGTGFTMSGATFPVTLNPSLAVTLEVQFDPTAAGAETGQLTIQSNSSTNGMAVIGLSGTGASASGSHQVTLSWDAPSSSPDPVVGYDIYRSTGGSSTYQLLNSSADTQTTYVDTNVQASTTYIYYVTSVDSSGVQSTSSNQATATIP